jgi:2-acylglycerol O-acyltransferase 2
MCQKKNGRTDSAVLLRCLLAGGSAAITLRFLLRSGWSTQKQAFVCLIAGYLPSYFDGSEYRAAPRRSCLFQRFSQRMLRRLVSSYFNVRVAIEDKDALAACKQCIISVHPHGVLSLDHAMTFCGYSEEVDALLPLTNRSALGANILYKIPFLREFLLWGGGVDAGRATASRCLQTGLSLSVVPGGEREQLLAQAGHTEQLILKDRSGFVRLALNHGVPLVPVYCFGEAQMYYQSCFFMPFRRWVQRKLGVALVMPYGRWGIPGLPLPVPLTYQVGKPIEMPKLPEATRTEVDEHHARYMREVQELFEKHKREAGYGDRELQLL